MIQIFQTSTDQKGTKLKKLRQTASFRYKMLNMHKIILILSILIVVQFEHNEGRARDEDSGAPDKKVCSTHCETF